MSAPPGPAAGPAALRRQLLLSCHPHPHPARLTACGSCAAAPQTWGGAARGAPSAEWWAIEAGNAMGSCHEPKAKRVPAADQLAATACMNGSLHANDRSSPRPASPAPAPGCVRPALTPSTNALNNASKRSPWPASPAPAASRVRPGATPPRRPAQPPSCGTWGRR